MQTILNPGNLLMVQERERYLAGLLRRRGYESLEGVRCFEAGCSSGHNLRTFVQWGANPADLAGMDLNPVEAEHMRTRSPEIRMHTGSAEKIPEPDESFDLTLAFTLFSSVPGEDISRGIAHEMFRITRPGGLIIIYDMTRGNPANPNVHPVTTDAIRRWFPRCPLKVKRITLAPPIARLLGRFAPWLYGPLASLPFLRTHALYVLRRPALPLIPDDANAGAMASSGVS
ncbi:MAG: class I SAM-dependent methyltransferase [Dehalococcoidia bacterium]|nr:class I SAM-dependent methyltransferase [Dehalococcoidia bacterium]